MCVIHKFSKVKRKKNIPCGGSRHICVSSPHVHRFSHLSSCVVAMDVVVVVVVRGAWPLTSSSSQAVVTVTLQQGVTMTSWLRTKKTWTPTPPNRQQRQQQLAPHFDAPRHDYQTQVCFFLSLFFLILPLISTLKQIITYIPNLNTTTWDMKNTQVSFFSFVFFF